MADEERNNQQAEETPVEPEASVETPPEPDPEAPPEEPGPPVPEPETPEPVPAPEEPAPPVEPIAEASASEEETEAAEAAAPAEGPSEVRRKQKRVPRTERRQRSKPKREQAGEHATRPRITKTQHPERPRGRRQERRGVVVSAAMDKTIVVRVELVKSHPRYKKVVRRSQRFHAHDEQNQAKAGDIVRIVETRPVSKTKNWRLAEVVEAAK
jgi:small subunit ribosomal protein S17